MGTPTRRAVLKGTAAFAGLAAAQASGLAPAAQAGTRSRHPKANVLLVHGAWVDGSSWSLVIAILQRDGYNVLAVQLPLYLAVPLVIGRDRAAHVRDGGDPADEFLGRGRGQGSCGRRRADR